MNRTEKAELIETLQSTLSEATTVVVTHQVGLTVAESSDLRARMREAGAGFKVTKNRLTKIALQGTILGSYFQCLCTLQCSYQAADSILQKIWSPVLFANK